ncbi:MAG: cyclodeaminase/cyclohydrolase family protein [Oscillospiraceae bacterium]|nr:cyclodeaminase/cyclohydrolase family protein [Oscillospiraceae bacterium]
MMALIDQSVQDFSAALASRAAVPGGGGASAAAAALGAALGEMVGALTVGKPKYAAAEDALRGLMARAETLRLRLLDCVDRDAAAFAPLAEAYAIPKDEPTRAETLERCLRAAAAVPLELLELCCEGIALQEAFAEKGSALAVSDAATGAALLNGALYGAAVNVKVNTRLMRDRAYADALDARVDALLAEYPPRAQAVFARIYGA